MHPTRALKQGLLTRAQQLMGCLCARFSVCLCVCMCVCVCLNFPGDSPELHQILKEEQNG